MPKGTGSLYKTPKATSSTRKAVKKLNSRSVNRIARKGRVQASTEAVQGIMEEAAGRVTGTAGPKGPVKKAQTSNPIPQDDIQGRAFKRDMQAIKNMTKANQRLREKSKIARERMLKNTQTGRRTTRQFINQLEGNTRNFDRGLARTQKALDAGAFHEALPAKKK